MESSRKLDLKGYDIVRTRVADPVVFRGSDAGVFLGSDPDLFLDGRIRIKSSRTFVLKGY